MSVFDKFKNRGRLLGDLKTKNCLSKVKKYQLNSLKGSIISMTFWEKYYELCNQRGTSPNAVASKLGFSNATCTKWKNGSKPSSKSISKIANYFEISIDYLLNDESADPQLTSEPLDKTDQEILFLARKTKDLSEEDKKKFLEVLRGSVNAFLKGGQ